MEPTILNQRYRLVDLIGAGGMATVYRGQDLLLERTVAVKFLRDPHTSDPELRQRFLAEARAVAKLDHPNIVHIYDVGEDAQQRPYIVMEMVEGEDLKTLIRRYSPLQVPHAINLVRQICAGVGHAHRASIVHCDLKPQNILVTAEGQIKVADFGIARALQSEDENNDPEARDTVIWGSPHYISPERAQGKPPVAASDVYSIGIILYELLTGVPPFHDPDPMQLAIKHLTETPALMSTLNPRVPPGLNWLACKVLEKEPANRYRNADQLGMALDEYVRQGESMTQAQAAVIPPPTTPPVIPPSPATVPSASSATLPAPPPEQAENVFTDPLGPDFMLWSLLGVAAIAVIGLLPLWIYVYQTYMPSQAVATIITQRPTPTPVVQEQMVSVPNLVGLNAPDAQQRAESLNLKIEVLGEEESIEARPGAILEQTPSPGSRVTVDTIISVIVAAGRAFMLPDVVGYTLEAVQEGLESEGLFLVIEEVWSTEANNTVLVQIPETGAEVRAGNTITLTVSGGIHMPIPMQVNLNGQIMLEQALVSQLSFRPGDSVPVFLKWRSLQTINRSYKVFVHLLSADIQLVAQDDTEPVNGLRPTNGWTPGEIINDPHQILLPSNVPAGVYHIRVGLYDAEGRLPVVDAGETQIIDHTIFITQIKVEP